MTIVKLFKVQQATQEPAAVFDDGEFFIGRNQYLNDRRISRQHGLLKVSDAAVTITAVHQNPCYYKTDEGAVQVLMKNDSVALKDKDEFSFLKEDFWLRVEICDNNVTSDTITNINNKRKCEFDSNDVTSKIVRADDSSVEIKQETDLELEEQTVQTSTQKQPLFEQTNTQLASSSCLITHIKKEPEETVASIKDNSTDENIATTSNATSSPNQPDNSVSKQKRKWRDRCWYGKQCYRKNAEHRARFRHYGDSDFDSDPDDDRPSCSYGTACYRQNLDHRRNYRHPSNGGNIEQAALRRHVTYQFNKCVCHFYDYRARSPDTDSD